MYKLYQGDCLELLKNIPDKSVDLVLTDIPYNAVNRASNGLRNLDKGKADVLTFDLDALITQLFRVGGGVYMCFVELNKSPLSVVR